VQFSSRFTIAVHTLLCIAQFDGVCRTTSKFLAGSVNVNPVIIRNILIQLKAAGLVTVEPGVGGASLSRDPADITLLDIFRAVEPQEPLFHFHEHPNPECPVGSRVHGVLDSKLDSVQSAMEGSLAAVTLKNLLEEL
jgi:Rrf2 family protein